MDRDTYHLLAPVTNINDSILGVHLEPGFQIEKWSYTTPLLNILETLLSDSISSSQIQYILESSFCVLPSEDFGYVITGKIHVDDVEKHEKNDPLYSLRILEGHMERLENRIQLMRLFKEGRIGTLWYFFYKKENDKIIPYIDIRQPFIEGYEPYNLEITELADLNNFIDSCNFPFSLPYLQLAYDNFEESYHTENNHMAFLSLMIAVEALFNVGQHDLRYRISRSLAVLLSETVEMGEEIFGEIKQFYDKRSLLVHTGRVMNLSYDDIIELRDYLRASIKKIYDLNIPKDALAKKLTALGYGQPIS